MPFYTFRCKKCEQVFEELTSWDNTGKYKDVACPNCKSKKKERTYNDNVNCTFSKPQESSKWESFSYRAGFNMEKAKADRRRAAAKSHVGENPYNFKQLD